MVQVVGAGRFAWIGGGEPLAVITHVDNPVEGLMLGASKGRPGNAYFVTDGEPVVFREFVSELLRTQGVEPPTRSVPDWLAATLAVGGETTWHTLHLGGRPPLTRFAYWVPSQKGTIRIDKARDKLGYQPGNLRKQG